MNMNCRSCEITIWYISCGLNVRGFFSYPYPVLVPSFLVRYLVPMELCPSNTRRTQQILKHRDCMHCLL